jgi:hypothetical protein
VYNDPKLGSAGPACKVDGLRECDENTVQSDTLRTGTRTVYIVVRPDDPPVRGAEGGSPEPNQLENMRRFLAGNRIRRNLEPKPLRVESDGHHFARFKPVTRKSMVAIHYYPAITLREQFQRVNQVHRANPSPMSWISVGPGENHRWGEVEPSLATHRAPNGQAQLPNEIGERFGRRMGRKRPDLVVVPEVVEEHPSEVVR